LTRLSGLWMLINRCISITPSSVALPVCPYYLLLVYFLKFIFFCLFHTVDYKLATCEQFLNIHYNFSLYRIALLYLYISYRVVSVYQYWRRRA